MIDGGAIKEDVFFQGGLKEKTMFEHIRNICAISSYVFTNIMSLPFFWDFHIFIEHSWYCIFLIGI